MWHIPPRNEKSFEATRYTESARYKGQISVRRGTYLLTLQNEKCSEVSRYTESVRCRGQVPVRFGSALLRVRSALNCCDNLKVCGVEGRFRENDFSGQERTAACQASGRVYRTYSSHKSSSCANNETLLSLSFLPHICCTVSSRYHLLSASGIQCRRSKYLSAGLHFNRILVTWI